MTLEVVCWCLLLGKSDHIALYVFRDFQVPKIYYTVQYLGSDFGETLKQLIVTWNTSIVENSSCVLISLQFLHVQCCLNPLCCIVLCLRMRCLSIWIFAQSVCFLLAYHFVCVILSAWMCVCQRRATDVSVNLDQAQEVTSKYSQLLQLSSVAILTHFHSEIHTHN